MTKEGLTFYLMVLSCMFGVMLLSFIFYLARKECEAQHGLPCEVVIQPKEVKE